MPANFEGLTALGGAAYAVRTIFGKEMPSRDGCGDPITSKNVMATGRELDQDSRGSTLWQEDWKDEDDGWLDGHDDNPGHVYVMARDSAGRKMFRRNPALSRTQKGRGV